MHHEDLQRSRSLCRTGPDPPENAGHHIGIAARATAGYNSACAAGSGRPLENHFKNL